MIRLKAIGMWAALPFCAGFFAAMGKAGGGRNELDPRFLSKLSIFNMTFPCDDTVRHIYRSIIAGHTGNFAEEIRSTVPVIVEASLGLYKVRHSTYSMFLNICEKRLSTLTLLPYVHPLCLKLDDALGVDECVVFMAQVLTR
jgi:hypothetical protein